MLFCSRWPVVVAAALSLTAAGGATAANEWQAVLERDGIKVFARDVPGSRMREVRGFTVIAAPVDTVVAALADIANYPSFMPLTRSGRLLRRAGDTSSWYMTIDPPVIRQRDYCIRTTHHRLPSGGYHIDWSTVSEAEGCPPRQPGLVRIEQNRGQWLLLPTADGRSTQVMYEAHTDPGGAVPAWIANSASARTVPDVVGSLRVAVKMPRYAQASVR